MMNDLGKMGQISRSFNLKTLHGGRLSSRAVIDSYVLPLPKPIFVKCCLLQLLLSQQFANFRNRNQAIYSRRSI